MDRELVVIRAPSDEVRGVVSGVGACRAVRPIRPPAAHACGQCAVDCWIRVARFASVRPELGTDNIDGAVSSTGSQRERTHCSTGGNEDEVPCIVGPAAVVCTAPLLLLKYS